MYKTIKQIADDIGIDKQRVYRYIKRNHISEAHQRNGVMYYDDVVQNTIIRAFADDTTSSDVHQNHITDAVNDTVDMVVDVLKSQIETQKIALETLQAQLEVKDKQIEQLRAELAEERQHSREQSDKLAVIADQSQKLQLAQMRTSEMIEDKQETKRHWWQRKR